MPLLTLSIKTSYSSSLATFPPLAFKISSLLFHNPLNSPHTFLSMAVSRTPNLPAWDMVPPPLDALRCFGLAEIEDVPLLVDSAGHI